MTIDRRTALALAGGILALSPETASADAGMLTAAGFAADTGDKLDLGVRAGLLNGLHGVVVRRGGKTVLERYWSGSDWSWATDLGRVAHGPETLHDLRSVSKSIVGLLYGIALAEKKVPEQQAKLLDQFPQYSELAKDPQRAAWTIQHVLDMVLGVEWNEDLPYTDARNSEIAMEMAPDRYRFILERPIVAPAGARWTYNGGCTALLGKLIADGVGMPLETYAREKLFTPLDIAAFDWIKGSNGVAAAASGLRLRLPDLAKIGDVLLAKGRVADREAIPPVWIEATMKPSVPIGDGRQYSHQWYVTEQFVPAANKVRRVVSAIGNGGQRLFVAPSLDLTVAVSAGNYNQPDQWIVPTLVLQKLILANMQRV
jgi:CubicO group peptidase (beta-lactamase class C family)